MRTSWHQSWCASQDKSRHDACNCQGMKTSRDVEITVFDVQPEAMRTTITIPAGTRVGLVKDGMGKTLYFVDNVPLLIRLTGNSHDPTYRFVFVPADSVAL